MSRQFVIEHLAFGIYLSLNIDQTAGLLELNGKCEINDKCRMVNGK